MIVLTAGREALARLMTLDGGAGGAGTPLRDGRSPSSEALPGGDGSAIRSAPAPRPAPRR